MIVFDDFLLLDAAGPIEVFATSNDEAGVNKIPRYDLRVVSIEGGLVRSSSGLEVATVALPRPPVAAGSTIIVAGGEGVTRIEALDPLVRWLRKAAPAALRICSVCTGAFVLARAGLMDGLDAVTHWRDVEAFERQFPAVRVRADALYVRSGKIYSSAGVTAGIDLCLALIEQDRGRGHALAVAKRLVVHSKRAGGQLQFSSELLAQSAPAQPFETLVRKLHESPASDWSVERMAATLHMSTRTFHRRFVQTLGKTPLQFLARVRLEKACAMIERDRTALKTVARRCGFGTAVNMKNAFARRLGVTPTQYLTRFRA